MAKILENGWVIPSKKEFKKMSVEDFDYTPVHELLFAIEKDDTEELADNLVIFDREYLPAMKRLLTGKRRFSKKASKRTWKNRVKNEIYNLYCWIEDTGYELYCDFCEAKEESAWN